MKPVKIALYQPYPHGLDGLQKVVTNLALALPKLGFTPLVILPERGIYEEELVRNRIPYLVCEPGPAWEVYGRGASGLSYIFSPKRLVALVAYWRKLGRVLQEQGVSILHCNDYRAVLLGAPAARFHGIPAIWHMHGYIENTPANLLAAFLVNRTVLVSRGMLDYLRIPSWMLGAHDVIYNGLEDLPVEAAASERSRPVALAVGNLHPRKGYPALLRAFAKVHARMPQAECWIVGGPFGDGTHARELHALAESLQLGASLKFLGFSDRVNDLMREARLLVSSSRIEAFGLVATEAMNLLLPVVATRTGGLKDIVVDGQTGFLVGCDDENALGDRIEQLLRDPALAVRMGAAGKERLRQHFTLDGMAQQMAALYRSILPKTRLTPEPWLEPRPSSRHG